MDIILINREKINMEDVIMQTDNIFNMKCNINNKINYKIKKTLC